MRLPNDQSKYSSQFKYVEVAHYIPSLEKVARDQVGPKNNKKPRFIEWKDVQAYAKEHDYNGIYTSIWQYNKPSLEGSLKLGNLYFDLDSSDAERSRLDAVTLVEYLETTVGLLPGSIRVYFTGYKGFHVEVEALALGVTASNDLANTYRFIANDVGEHLSLSTIDFSVYDERRMWRAPYTRHQTTGLYKCEVPRWCLSLDIDEVASYAHAPDVLEVPEQSFNYKANEWYREYTYKMVEQTKPTYTTQDLLERFNKHGSKMIRKVDEEKEFDPVELFEGCPSILKWWEYAEKNNDLPHEARLFLCSILTYSEEAIFYLHEILKNCSDYSWEKSNSHISDWIRRREMGIGGRPYTCERANSAGVGCGECTLEPRKKWIEVNGTWIESDEEAHPSPIRFAYSRKQTS